MRRMRRNLMSIMAMALLIGPGLVQDADAQIRFKAALHTPNVHIRVGNGYYGPYRRGRIRHLPIRRRRVYRINERDRNIARRLAWYSGVQMRELIRLRSYGYNWFEIGRWIDLPRPVVNAAMNQRSWKRFLIKKGLLAQGGNTPQGHGRLIYTFEGG